MSTIEIGLLGELRLWSSDRVIKIANQKGMLLIALLAHVPGKRHRREAIQALLWPASDQRHGQGNLRFILHQLKRIFGKEGALLSDHRSIWMNPDLIAVDIGRFEMLVRTGTFEALTSACALYVGDFFSNATGLTPGYEEWLLPERERVRELAVPPFGVCSRSSFGAVRCRTQSTVRSATLRLIPTVSACMPL